MIGMHIVRRTFALLLLCSCSVPSTDVNAAGGPALSHWADPEVSQLSSSALSRAPECTATTPPLNSDSLGPFRPGQMLQDVLRRCTRVEPLWDWGDEGIPAPALVLRLGEAVASVLLSDTLPESRVLEVELHSASARTRAGLGVGSAFTELVRAYGQPTLYEGECSISAVFEAEPALVWRLDVPEGMVGCETILKLVEQNVGDQIPEGTRIRSVRLISRELQSQKRR